VVALSASSLFADSPVLARFKGRLSLSAPDLSPLVLALLAGNMLLWTVLAAVSHQSLDTDNMEQLVWAASLEWGYYKHPPLPTWLMHGFVTLFGRPLWAGFFLGQLSVALSLWLVWKFACEVTSQRRALIATLLIMPIAYFTVRGVMHNHNTVQLWPVAGAIWMLWRATRTQSLWAWVALGLFCGLAALTKYSFAVQLAAFGFYLAVAGYLKMPRIWLGIALAAAVFFAILMPHLLWLQSHAENPLVYAGAALRSQSGPRAPGLQIPGFLLVNLARILPMLLALGWLAWCLRQESDAGSVPLAQSNLWQTLAPPDRLFIALVGWGPLLLTMIMVTALQTRVVTHWAATFFMLFGLLAFRVLRQAPEEQTLRITLRCVVVLQIVTATGFAIGVGPLPDYVGRAARSTFPGKAVSLQLQASWRASQGGPLRTIAADTWLGGNIAIHSGRQAQVFIDADRGASPWVTDAILKDCGMLVAVDRSPQSSDIPAPAVLALLQAAPVQGTLTMPWTMKAAGLQVVVAWGIYPAKDNAKPYCRP
jgi:4-amino-4-deoxy-L-arabinose transferase-like glycosyltransferase